VTAVCRVLGVSPSGYYAWQKRPLSALARADVELTAHIDAIPRASRGTYGPPRIHAELGGLGIHVGRKRVAWLMRALGVHGVSRRRQPRTTLRDPAHLAAPDLATSWRRAQPAVGGGHHVHRERGRLPVSRRRPGRVESARDRLGDRNASSGLAALDMAVAHRRPADVIHHSDQGCQYTSLAFGRRCRAAGIRPSLGSVGDAYDNALGESFFATLECELLDRQRFATPAAARLAVFEFIEGWYNPRRRHSALAYLSPHDYERRRALTPDPVRHAEAPCATS
jgi:putative transposase